MVSCKNILELNILLSCHLKEQLCILISLLPCLVELNHPVTRLITCNSKLLIDTNG